MSITTNLPRGTASTKPRKLRACSTLYNAARQLQAYTGGAPGDGLQPDNPL